jgi:hypothetical protein
VESRVICSLHLYVTIKHPIINIGDWWMSIRDRERVEAATAGCVIVPSINKAGDLLVSASHGTDIDRQQLADRYHSFMLFHNIQKVIFQYL